MPRCTVLYWPFEQIAENKSTLCMGKGVPPHLPEYVGMVNAMFFPGGIVRRTVRENDPCLPSTVIGGSAYAWSAINPTCDDQSCREAEMSPAAARPLETTVIAVWMVGDAAIIAYPEQHAVCADEIPVIPLYTQVKRAAMRPDMCGVQLDPSASSALWNLEEFAYGDTCSE